MTFCWVDSYKVPRKVFVVAVLSQVFTMKKNTFKITVETKVAKLMNDVTNKTGVLS